MWAKIGRIGKWIVKNWVWIGPIFTFLWKQITKLYNKLFKKKKNGGN